MAKKVNWLNDSIKNSFKKSIDCSCYLKVNYLSRKTYIFYVFLSCKICVFI